jgi:hypothetical protein
MSDYIGDSLKNLGHYRVQRVQEIAHEENDNITGVLLLCLGLRETGLRNINNPAKTDKGWVQISDIYHHDWLFRQPGCKAGTWTPVVGHNAAEPDYCPRFTPACRYAIELLQDGINYASSHGVPKDQQVRFAIASYNAGIGGAYKGWREGNVDKYTTGGDYSRWVLDRKPLVSKWIKDHPNWLWTPEQGG